jgi:hypothetical protein
MIEMGTYVKGNNARLNAETRDIPSERVEGRIEAVVVTTLGSW